jgi:hypothetical protein
MAGKPEIDVLEILLAARCETRMEAMRRDRLSWWAHWAAVGEYFLPRRYTWLVTPNQYIRGTPINGKIIDETGTNAWRALGSGLVAGICSPGRPWMRYTLEDTDLAAWGPVKEYLDVVSRRTLAIMANSNYYTAKATQLGDIALFGTAPIVIDENQEKVISCYNPCAGEYFCANDDTLRVNVFYREFLYTTAQLMQRFDRARLPEAITNQARSGSTLQNEWIVAHAIEPNDDELGERRGYVVPSHFPYRSVYWLRGLGRTKGLLKISGYYEWAAPTPRWDISGNDAYGRSPAMDALGSQKQLWMMQQRLAQAIDKMVNPPLLADITLKGEKTSSLPGGITYVAGLGSTAGMKSVYDVKFDIAAMTEAIQDVRGRINEVFFKDLFLMISQLDTVRSATEIDARREEKLIQLGPMYERFQTESLGPDIERIFGIAQRYRLLPKAPAVLQGMNLKLEYSSVLSQQQKAASTAAIERVLQLVGNLSASMPDAADNIDVDTTIQIYADLLGTPAKVLRDSNAMATMRAQRIKQAQQQQLAAMTPQMVQGAKVLSQTDLGGGQNALAAMMGGGQAPAQAAAA